MRGVRTPGQLVHQPGQSAQPGLSHPPPLSLMRSFLSTGLRPGLLGLKLLPKGPGASLNMGAPRLLLPFTFTGTTYLRDVGSSRVQGTGFGDRPGFKFQIGCLLAAGPWLS